MRDAFDTIGIEVKPRTRLLPLAQESVLSWTESMYVNDVYQGLNVDKQAPLPGSWAQTDDFVVKHFKSLQGEGYVILNPYKHVIVSHDCVTDSGTFVLRTGSTTSTFIDTGVCEGIFRPELFPPVPAIPTASVQAAKDQALIRAYAKAKSADVDLLVDLAELRSTVNMFKKCVDRFSKLASEARLLSDIIRARSMAWWRVYAGFSVKRFRAKDLAGLYLEARYGWGPLLDSIAGIANAIEAMSGQRMQRLTYRASEAFNFSSEAVADRTTYPNGVAWPRFYRSRIEYDATFRAGILVDVEHKWLDHLGLRPRYIPSALWDLVPFSFVVDWFLYVGNLIKALTPSGPNHNLSDSWLVERSTRKITFESEFMAASGTVGSSSAIQPHMLTRYSILTVSTIRTIHGEPPLVVPLKHNWSQFTNLKHLVDALCLAVKLIKLRIR